MAYSVIITLTNLGSAVGPFDLYSDVDNFTTPFETNVAASEFVWGYFTTNVPNGTLQIKVKSEGECINFIITDVQNLPTPSVTATQTPSPTPTCPVTTQYLQVSLSDSTKFTLSLWNDAGYTSSTTANCNYIISGTAYGSLGTVYNGTETINAGQHSHQFNLAPVLLPGETVTGFTVDSYTTSGCPCPVNLIFPLPPTPTPTGTPQVTPTPSSTPVISPTVTQTASPTPSGTPPVTPTVTPTGSVTQLFVYAKYVNSGADLYYSLEGAPAVNFAPIDSVNCTYLGEVPSVSAGDSIEFSTEFTNVIYAAEGFNAGCPSLVGGVCSYTMLLSPGPNYIYITMDGSNSC